MGRVGVMALLRGDSDGESGVLIRQYEHRLLSEVSRSVKNARKWLTYNQLVIELVRVGSPLASELRYRLSEDDSDPSAVCMDVVGGILGDDSEIDRLYNKISNF